MEQLEAMVETINKQLSLIIDARDDIRALMRIDASINNAEIATRVLTDAKNKLKVAAQNLIDLLSV